MSLYIEIPPSEIVFSRLFGQTPIHPLITSLVPHSQLNIPESLDKVQSLYFCMLLWNKA